MWSGPKGASVQERLDRAQDAKKALLERFKKQPGPGDKEYEERQAQLKAVADARREREELRVKQKAEEAVRRAEEARLKAERDVREAKEAADRAIREAAEAAERKARRGDRIRRPGEVRGGGAQDRTGQGAARRPQSREEKEEARAVGSRWSAASLMTTHRR